MQDWKGFQSKKKSKKTLSVNYPYGLAAIDVDFC